MLVTGTAAFDFVGTYPGSFTALQRHTGINVSLHLDGVDRQFGGCAMNIAYSLHGLGDAPAPFAFVGSDFQNSAYGRHLRALGIDASGIRETSGTSSHAFIFSDVDGNQFTAFYPGPARNPAYRAELDAFVASGTFAAAVAGPDIPENMINCLDICRAHSIPVISDPGQVITDFTNTDIAALIERTETLIVNEYEHTTILNAVGEEKLANVERVVVTRGGRPISWRRGARWHDVEVPLSTIVDPTGAGDAFRAGFVHADLRTDDMGIAVRSGVVTAKACIAQRGAQVHDLALFAEQYRETWGEPPPWLAED